jgi:hypothetical protein
VIFVSANSARSPTVLPVPDELLALIAQVPDRVVFQSANANRAPGLPSIPEALHDLVLQVPPRIIFNQANAGRMLGLDYPVALVGDTAPPQIGQVSARANGATLVVRWTTDEFATSAVRCGIQPGTYTTAVTDLLYAKDHAIAVDGLPPDATYYYVVSGVDRSGNLAESPEYSAQAASVLYLPLVTRY